ncbi:hypothetical protein LSAT2_005572 [Lamellibrachia satsuma]|nr:hypothetical protein LSAT2_005572 [Lamellibrachia satsuma]
MQGRAEVGAEPHPGTSTRRGNRLPFAGESARPKITPGCRLKCSQQRGRRRSSRSPPHAVADTAGCIRKAAAQLAMLVPALPTDTAVPRNVYNTGATPSDAMRRGRPVRGLIPAGIRSADGQTGWRERRLSGGGRRPDIKEVAQAVSVDGGVGYSMA